MVLARKRARKTDAAPTASRRKFTTALNDLHVHFQVEGVREDAEEAYAGIRQVPESVEMLPGCEGDLKALPDAMMHVTVTIAHPESARAKKKHVVKKSDPWIDLLKNVHAPMKLQIHTGVSKDSLKRVVTELHALHTVELIPWEDDYLQSLAELVQLLLHVKKISLCLPDHASSSLSTEAFSGLLQALSKVPSSSKLEILEIPAVVRRKITGDPIEVADALRKCEKSATAMRILKLEPTEIPPPAIPEIDPRDSITLWLPYKGIGTFVEDNAVQFSRKRLLASSGFLQTLMKDNPDENRIPLPMHELKQRSVSVEALQVTSKLLQRCADGRSKQSSSDSKPAWKIEFQEVYEAAFLPALEHSAFPAFRRQLALKLFGEILELGRYLELRVAYEFGLVGGVATFSDRLSASTDSS